MDDIDLVIVSGVIVSVPDIQDNIPNGRVAINFVIESQKTIQGKPKYFKHQITAWDVVADKFKDKIIPGTRVRVEGHLQASVLSYVDTNGVSRTYFSDRVNAKHMTF